MVKRTLGIWLVMGGLFGGGTALAAPVSLELADMHGREHRLQDYRGQWVVVNYWATWCVPCRTELPELQAFYTKYRHRGVMVIGVNYEDTPQEKVQAFVKQHRLGFPVWLASPDEPSPLGEVRGLPTTFIVAPSGEVVARHQGKVTEAMLVKLTRRSGAPAAD
ncbi:MAG: TlpA family protein disulfide reductase [Gammaproteobacteria bacterium]|nr:TlpA family protein disulfide reductase [Gammaproteobacteria bacterium]